jgi:arsenate reductase (glutaredoxin)
MNKIFHLSTCKTCQNIIKELNPSSDFELIDIKKTNVTEQELDKMAEIVGGYLPLFSKKSMKYRSLGLADKVLSEQDLRRLILDEYTFLKRPVISIKDKIFAGNAKATIEAVKKEM